ncbi:regulatory protein RecX [Magnetospirillum sulfuroxidans]|uniref:Regulatory protein RecX n=1 Tax=Magnetospirillum sulfuroxidans TaxID=611300 RepID=A0ABS5IEB4_9PROT|nr:regulatory protein RecX [Magnetospirillum sulfuroxidans]MBR9972507.1 RecX family transcriptional regulator [Magnetospirillum sulfuroxidans]
MAVDRIPPKITPSYLENAALHYLERFAASSAGLRRVLARKIDRSLAHWGGERGEHMAAVDAVIAKLTGLGYLNDAAYAEMKTRALHRQGKATRVIRATLAAKGVDSELTDQAVDALADEHLHPDLAAAIRLAKKRRLGPFRLAEARAAFRAKDMAILARAGFDFDTVRQVIDADSSEVLDEILD